MLRKWGALVLLLLATPLLAFAQTTGKLAGTVVDASTGEPLPGANVLIVGTQLGTVTDVDGNYFIIGVPVGTYDVQASFVGFQTQTVQGVDINAGYTRELNFELAPGVELEEIVVEYERPLIQKDAIGVPKVMTSEELTNLPVRGVAQVASIQAGVVAKEGSNNLYVRGGREEEVVYYVDGVKVLGGVPGVPQTAIQEQEMIIGNISARYGDAMSGVINIITKSGASDFFGSIEGVTSEALDPYGYNLVSGSIGGPLVSNKLNFFLSGEFTDQQVRNPAAVGQLSVDASTLEQLRANPQVITALDADGQRVFVDLPGNLSPGATVEVAGFDENGNPLFVDENGTVRFSDGTTVSLPEGAQITSVNQFNPSDGAGVLPVDAFELKDDYDAAGYQRFALDGNLSLNPFESVRLRLGGRYIQTESEGFRSTFQRLEEVVFAPENFTRFDNQNWQVYGTWTHYLSNNTFYQLQVDFADVKAWDYDSRFGRDIENILFYGDIDHEANSVLRRYKQLSLQPQQHIVGEDTLTVQVPQFTQRFTDGLGGLTATAASLVLPPGGEPSEYDQRHNQQFRVSATATTQIGLHQIEFGGEYEQRTLRRWFLYAPGTPDLARWFADESGAEGASDIDGDGQPDAVTSYEQLPFQAFDGGQNANFFYFGYNYLGTEEVDDEDLTAFQNGSNLNVAPYKPIYYGGYIQDKIEFRDIVLNLGLRVDVFDNNTRVYRDPWARLPIIRAADLSGVDVPAGIGDDYAVYFAGNDVVGYRDLNGRFYDANGQETKAGNVVLQGRPQRKGGTITEEVFKDYEPQVTVMPRIGVSFPVTDQALFFARYGVVSQRPSEAQFEPLIRLLNRRALRIGNPDLRPQRTIEYELGFRQRLGARAAVTISGFFRQIKDLAQLRIITNAFPNDYTTFQNVDFGTVKGAEFAFDLRRTNGVALNANYTLQYANGTGSDASSTTTIVWVNETQPNFISPLDFDQRHRINLSVDYRLGEGEGPTIGGAKLLQNFGVNLLFQAGSGFPFTRVLEPNHIRESKAPQLQGGVNEDRMPWTNRLDLRLDRRFPLGGVNATAFLWVTNLLDSDNVMDVWRATGLGANDGFLATPRGQEFLDSQASPATAEMLYEHMTRYPINFGLPRQIRLGVRVDF